MCLAGTVDETAIKARSAVFKVRRDEKRLVRNAGATVGAPASVLEAGRFSRAVVIIGTRMER